MQTIEFAEIVPATRPIDADVRLPGSKSYTNRALLIAAMAKGESHLGHALFSDDTRYMIGALRALGIAIEARPDAEEIQVVGLDGPPTAADADLFVGNAGTAARFLTAYVALGTGHYRIDGVKRMHERPIGPLLTALGQLGVDARSEDNNGCPPVVVESRGIAGGTVSIPGHISSQFISALMMIAPMTVHGIELAIEGDLVSKPYVDLTASVMEAFGARVRVDEYRHIGVPGHQPYQARSYTVEPDASAASYFLAAAAITGGRVRIDSLGKSSAQGDLRLAQILEEMGCEVTWAENWLELRGPPQLHGIDVNMGELSDVAQTVAAIAPFADGPVRIRGIGHIRHKETDRLRAVTTELKRLGASLEET
ncbi:MAG TPA: 3-phosphoshikimate 1-carboxyvinyltransferase, partial [Chloroflexota bacterium]|nr:3-phosphoshikimate 1-carboxyvinyltransferase [Chloroflexota bacterium]